MECKKKMKRKRKIKKKENKNRHEVKEFNACSCLFHTLAYVIQMWPFKFQLPAPAQSEFISSKHNRNPRTKHSNRKEKGAELQKNELFKMSKAKADFTTSSYRNKASALLRSTFLFPIPHYRCMCTCLCGIVSKTYSIQSNYSTNELSQSYANTQTHKHT